MNVLLVDGNDSVRSALKFLLEAERDVEIVGEETSLEHLLDNIFQHCPDLILLDWDTRRTSIETLKIITDVCPNVYIVLLSSQPEIKRVAAAANVEGFISKGGPPSQLLQVIHQIKDKMNGKGDPQM